MKIIELFTLMAKGEKVPKKIKYAGKIYEYSDNDKFYYNNGYSIYRDFYTEGNCLNDEVEIIEEEKEIEKLDLCINYEYEEVNDELEEDMHKIVFKINELIDVINDMRDKENV